MHSDAVWLVVFGVYSLWLFWLGYSYGRIFTCLDRMEKILRRNPEGTDGE